MMRKSFGSLKTFGIQILNHFLVPDCPKLVGLSVKVSEDFFFFFGSDSVRPSATRRSTPTLLWRTLSSHVIFLFPIIFFFVIKKKGFLFIYFFITSAATFFYFFYSSCPAVLVFRESFILFSLFLRSHDLISSFTTMQIIRLYE